MNFIKPFLRGWLIIVGAMTLSYLLASKYLSYVTPMYESTAKLKLADLHEGVPNSNLFKDFDVFASSQKIQAEIELITSHAIIKKALGMIPFEQVLVREGNLKSTELFNDAPIIISKIAMEPALLDKPFSVHIQDENVVQLVLPGGEMVQGTIGDTLHIGHSAIVILLNHALISKKNDLKINDKYIVTFLSEERQISEILKSLDVTSVDKDVPVIRISYKSSHPEKAALFPNVLAQAYIEDYIQTKYGAANVTGNFLDERIDDISNKLSGAESAILNYRESNKITNIRQETETDLRKISQLKIQQTNLKMSLDAIKELDNYMESGKDHFLDLAPNFEAFTDLLSTEMVKKIKQLQAEKKDLLLVYTPKDEKVITIDRKIEDMSSYLKESIRNTKRNLETKYNNLAQDIETSEKVFITVPEKERIMTILNREFDIYQQSYNFLNQKKIEADIAKAAKVAFHRIITPASVSKMPVSPNRTIIKGVAVILGMLGAMMLIFIVHTMKARVNDLSAVESQSMIPVIAAVPKLKEVIAKNNFFLTMLTQWKVKGVLLPNGIISFTGFKPNEGARFIALEVIHTLSRQNRKILVINFGTIEENTAFFSLQKHDDTISTMTLNTSRMMFKTTEEIQSAIQEYSTQFDYTILKNADFGDTYTLAMMAVADVNVVCIDTRLTPAKKVVEIDMLKEEYKLSNVYFAVNRAGYNPNFMIEVIRTVKKMVAILKNSRKI